MIRVIREIFNNERTVAIAVTAAMAATISTALYFEYALGYAPCALCVQQRIPYYVAIPTCLALLILGMQKKDARKTFRAVLWVAGGAMLLGAGLAVHHAGVEWGLWAGPAGCSAASFSGAVSGNLLDALNTVHPPSCGEASWRFLGLSFAGWNAVISAAIALTCFRVLIRNR